MLDQEVDRQDRGSVLIVEDDESMVLFATRVLDRAGFCTYQAESAESALKVLDEGGIDAVLTDVRLPGISGFELVRKARADNPKLRFVVMTAYPSAEADQEQKHGNFDGFLTKPVTPENLAAAITVLFPDPVV